MKKLLAFTLFILIASALSSCTKNSSAFSQKVQNDIAMLVVKNESGFMGVATPGEILSYTLRLHSAGGLDVVNMVAGMSSTAPINYEGGAYPGAGGTCGNVLPSGQSCIIKLLFTPDVAGVYTTRLSFSFNDTIATRVFEYDLKADSRPILGFEYGTQYDFGNKFIGSTTDLKIKVANIGGATAKNITINNLAAPFSFKGGAYPGTGGDCGTDLNTNDSCTMVIMYAPTTNASHLQDIVFTYKNDSKDEQSFLNLSGWGFYPAKLGVAANDSYDFGVVATNHPLTRTFTVTHLSGDVSAISVLLSGLTGPFSRVGGTCGAFLSTVQKTCTIIVQMNAAVVGSWTSPLNLSYHNGVQTVVINKTISGTTVNRPILSLSPVGTVSNGVIQVGTNKSTTFTVSYVSGGVAAIDLTLSNLPAPFSRTGGTCTTSLSSGSCTIIISFAPTTHGDWSQPLWINYNDTTASVASSTVIMTGTTEGKLTAAVTSYNFSNVVVGQTKDVVLQINFTGGTAVTGLGLQSLSGPFRFTNSSYPGSAVALVCGSTLLSGYCNIHMTYAPSATGTITNSIVLQYNNGVGTNTVSISLTGTGSPAAILSIEDKSYGNVTVNSSSPPPSLIKVTNTQSMTATGMSMTLPARFSYKGGTYPGVGGNCGTSLAGNTFCNLNIIFTPTSVTSYNTTFTFNYNDGTGARTATSSITGAGILSDALYMDYFDNVGFTTTYVGKTPQDITVRLIHGGNASATTISSKTVSGSADFSLVSNDCPASLVSGQSCNLVVRLGTSASGAKAATLTIGYTASGVPATIARSLSATVNTVASLAITPTPHSYGTLPVNNNYEQTFTLIKTGQYSPLNFSGALTNSGFIFKGESYPGTGGTCPTAVAMGASCTIVVVFRPVAALSYSSVLSVNYNNGAINTTASAAISGTGKNLSILNIGSANYHFGQVVQTKKSERTITITNSGTQAASSLNFSALTTAFNYKGGTYPGVGGSCSGSVATSQSCTLVIEFAPVITGLQQEVLQVSYNNGSGNVVVSTTLQGEGVSQAIINISENNPYDFGATNISGVISKIFTLSNVGSSAASELSGSFTAPVFSFLGGTFPGNGGNCSSTLASGISCTIALSFSPTSAVRTSGYFSLNYNDGVRTQIEAKELQGTGSLVFSSALYLSLLEEKTIPVAEVESSAERQAYYANEATDTLTSYSSLEIEDINRDGYEDQLVSTLSLEKKSLLSFVSVDRQSQKVLYRIYNLFKPDMYQGITTIELNKDMNKIKDGISDILIGIYKRDEDEFILVGYDIVCARSGNVIERYLLPLPRPIK